MRLCGRMCAASITRMTPDAPRGRDESASTGNAADQDASTSLGQAAARPIGTADAVSAATAYDADARGLVGLAVGGRVLAVPGPAVGPVGAPPDQEHDARLGSCVPRGGRGDDRR